MRGRVRSSSCSFVRIDQTWLAVRSRGFGKVDMDQTSKFLLAAIAEVFGATWDFWCFTRHGLMICGF